MGEFAGFRDEALDFYDDLEADNTKTFWAANKHRYDEFVAAPMKALAAELTEEFGETKIFRPYRDVRFSKDKTPYKTHQGLFVPRGPSTGYYVQIGPPGIEVAVGFYGASPARLATFRDAIVNDLHGPELEQILEQLESVGWKRTGERLKTHPRGYDPEHPRIELLRHKSLSVRRERGFGPDVIGTPDLVDVIRADWREATVLTDWVIAHAKD